MCPNIYDKHSGQNQKTDCLDENNNKGINRVRYFAGFFFAVVLGAVLLFANLGDRALWDDEAQTAVLARQIVQSGLPMFKAGENIPTDRADLADFNSDRVFIWNTWLPYYLNAISFRFFGETEWAARLPFALFGLLTLILYFRLSLRLFSLRTTLFALLLLVLSVPFLLHMRQCRYYAIIAFVTLWMVWAYLSVLDRKKSGWIQLSVAGILCFHSFPIISGLNIAGIWLHALWNERRFHVMRDLGLMTGTVLLCASPAIVYMRLWEHPSKGASTLPEFLRSFWVYLLWINGFLLPFALPVLTAIVQRLRGWLPLLVAYLSFLAGASLSAAYSVTFMTAILLSLLLLFVLRVWPLIPAQPQVSETFRPHHRSFFYLAAILVVTYVVVLPVMSPYPFYRYVIPLVPPLLLCGAVLIESLTRINRALSVLVLSILLVSNLLSALPLKVFESLLSSGEQVHAGYSVSPREIWRWTAIRTDIISFLYEITHSISDPEKGVAAFLKERGTDGQTVKASYGDISLMFYMPKMRIISRLDKNGGIPDYIIERRAYRLAKSEQFLNALREVEYKAEDIPFANVVWSNNPDPLFHMYRIPGNMPHLRIYQRNGP